MTLSIHFECGVEYNGPTDRETMNKLAERYFANFILDYNKMEWCDVIIYDKHHHDIGASRNPPPLPHNHHICETCRFSCEPYRDDIKGLICCNPNKEWQGITVLPESSCDAWRFNYDYYFKEEE